MGTEPDELKTEVEGARTRLAHDVDRLADKVTPGKVARRKADATQHRLTGLKERVMGVTDRTPDVHPGQKAQELTRSAGDAAGQAGDSVRRTADQVGQSVREAPGQVTRQTQGSPLAAGVIAFGAGMLAAALLPASEAEERVGAQLREHSDELLQPARQTAQDAAQDLKEGMRQPATDAVESVRSTAQEAAEATKQQVQDSGQEAVTGLREVGQDAARETREQTGR
ncbi:DUF3618 domain-containing protein [Streptomyces sp. NPDC079167]|uniref:DUF3618 domain-containing protein n=1 Tax=Streptomyces sp. NPDC079167 TaxID=3154513 RepID=UPI00342AB4CC